MHTVKYEDGEEKAHWLYGEQLQQQLKWRSRKPPTLATFERPSRAQRSRASELAEAALVAEGAEEKPGAGPPGPALNRLLEIAN